MTSQKSFTRKMARHHLGATRALGYTLTLGSREAWSDFRSVISLRLSDEERAALAFWALRSLSDDQAAATMRATADLLMQHNFPLPPLFGSMDEATFWADMAEPEELDAYCLASFNRMTAHRRGAFLNHVQRGAAA